MTAKLLRESLDRLNEVMLPIKTVSKTSKDHELLRKIKDKFLKIFKKLDWSTSDFIIVTDPKQAASMDLNGMWKQTSKFAISAQGSSQDDDELQWIVVVFNGEKTSGGKSPVFEYAINDGVETIVKFGDLKEIVSELKEYTKIHKSNVKSGKNMYRDVER